MLRLFRRPAYEVEDLTAANNQLRLDMAARMGQQLAVVGKLLDGIERSLLSDSSGQILRVRGRIAEYAISDLPDPQFSTTAHLEAARFDDGAYLQFADPQTLSTLQRIHTLEFEQGPSLAVKARYSRYATNPNIQIQPFPTVGLENREEMIEQLPDLQAILGRAGSLLELLVTGEIWGISTELPEKLAHIRRIP